MRKILLGFIILITVFALNSYAQDKSGNITDPGKRTRINFFGGLLAEPSIFDSKVGLSMGATMGISYLDHFYAGVYYVSLVTQHYRNQIAGWEGTKLRGSLNHGGIIAGYVWNPQSLMNINFNARAGWGSVWFYDDNENNSDILDELYRGTRDHLFFVTPGIEYTLTPINWLRIGFGLGYRFAFMVDRYKSDEFNSIVGTINISFGGFRNNAFGEQVTNPEQ